MNTRSVFWLGAVVCLVAGWADPPRVEAADFLVRKHHVSPDESEPEVPNGAVRAPQDGAIDESPRVIRPVAESPALCPEDWFTRVLRLIRQLNLGGLAR